MRGPSHDLFDLIKSLSRREKGYVYRHLKEQEGGDSSNNCILFKAYDKLQQPNESDLLTQLQDHAIRGYLPRAKTYLYQSILKILRDYHASSNPELKRLRELENVVTLYHLGLVDQAKKQLERLKKGAKELPAYLQMGALYQDLLIMLFTNVLEESGELRTRVNALLERVQQEGHWMDELARLQGLLFGRKMGADSGRLDAELKRIDLHGEAHSDFALDIGHRAQTLKSYFEGDDGGFDKFSQQRLQALRNSRLYAMYPILHLNALNNRIDFLFLNNELHGEVDDLLTELEQIRSSRFVGTRVGFRSMLFRCKLMLARRDFSYLKTAEEDYEALTASLPQLSFSAERGTINVLLGICHAATGQLEKSGLCLQGVYHDQNVGSVLLAICLCHLFLNAVELGETDMAEVYLQRLEGRALKRKVPVLKALVSEVFYPIHWGKLTQKEFLNRYAELEQQDWDYGSRAFFEEGYVQVRF